MSPCTQSAHRYTLTLVKTEAEKGKISTERTKLAENADHTVLKTTVCLLSKKLCSYNHFYYHE